MSEDSSPSLPLGSEPPDPAEESTFDWLLRALTGAYRKEAPQVLFSFLALFFLLVSYYLIKPLRTSYFLKEFDPTDLPKVYFWVPLLSLAVSGVFNWFCARVEKYRLITRVYLLIIGCKLAFTVLLPTGGKAVALTFFLWASVYFLLALPLLWACFNSFFRSEQSERCFGFIALGAALGTIGGGWLSSVIASSSFRSAAPVYAAAAMGLSLIFLLAASRRGSAPPVVTAPGGLGSVVPPEDVPVTARKGSFWQDLTGIVRDRYVLGIALMVCFLATFTTSLDFLSQNAIDRQMSRQQYLVTFREMNSALPPGDPAVMVDEVNPAGYDFIYSLKSAPEKDRPARISEFASRHHQDPALLTSAYKDYKETLEASTRKLFSDVNMGQGVLGLILLTFVARFLFKRCGLTVAVLIMPTFALLALAAYFFPLTLGIVEWTLILSGAFNYALNNATKEILYTATSEETKFKQKPIIEGPIMRVGDQGASAVTTGVQFAVMSALGGSLVTANRVVLGITCVTTLVWWFAIRRTGRIYDRERRS